MKIIHEDEIVTISRDSNGWFRGETPAGEIWGDAECGDYLCEHIPADDLFEDMYCSRCDGSGLGMYDGYRCHSCNGSGIEGRMNIVTEEMEPA
jgi:hypothetical protein